MEGYVKCKLAEFVLLGLLGEWAIGTMETDSGTLDMFYANVH